MDVDLLSKMIRELMLDSDEVTLPGIGTFVTEIIPATFSDKGYTINPPYRRLFFRERIDGGEDALIDFYAASNGIPKEQANKIIKDFLTEMMGVLREKKAIIFPGLGRLRATKENDLFFVADEDLDIWPAGFALEPISLKTHVETAEEVGAAVSSLRSILDSPEEKAAIEDVAEKPEASEKAQVEELDTQQVDVVEEEPDAKEEEQPEQKEGGQPGQDVPEPKRKISNGAKIIIWALLVLAILLAAYVIAGHLGLLDKLLYSPEELEFMRQGGL